MSEYLDRVKGYLLDLDLTIVAENEADTLVVVDDEDNGIKQLVIDCEPPIVVLEQLIAEVPAEPGDLFVRLLQMNNTLVHGAFVLDETGGRIFFRDTLQISHLDVNELEGSIRSLSLALAEYGAELLTYLKK
ncbi:MAG: YbjN domain-containing protein [Acidobacteria bacterium]|nr:YbjN domain-containing protein [Acidobacteriota bacterium]